MNCMKKEKFYFEEVYFMKISGLSVVQIPHSQSYGVYTPQGIQIAQVWMGQDGQLAYDLVALGYICKALAKRWDIKAK